jgi:hypothetical protein
LAALHARLAPGGTLVATVPVARRHRVETRHDDVYGLGAPQQGGERFFQRVYDLGTLSRLVEAAPWKSVAFRWFGEREPGWFAEYERRWMRDGLAEIVEDPRHIAERFREYRSWEEMPGDGVCGVVMKR